MRKPYTKLSNDQVKHINELLDECWGTRKIAAEVGTSRQLVNYYRRLRTEQARAFDGPKILSFDIETLPLESYTWGIFDQTVGLNQIKAEWAMLSVAAKWLGEDTVWYEDTRDRRSIRDDRDLVAKLCALLDQADIVVGHNVKRFDMKKLRARALLHEVLPFKEPLVQDTLTMARSIGSFTSNKLEYLSQHLTDSPKSKHSKFPGFELWVGVMTKDPDAWNELQEYNIQDVRSTESLYLKLRPWAKGTVDLGAYYPGSGARCPRCASINIHPTGEVLIGHHSYSTFVCKDCGGHSRHVHNVNSKHPNKGGALTAL